ncbi:MAG: GNAT family N-acetyltransferase [Burkholderiaceae bacterium]
MLRRLNRDDLARFHAYRSDPVVGRFQGWSPMSNSDALAFIDRMAVAELFKPGAWMQLAIARSDDGALVGDLGLFVAENGEHAELGVTVSPEAQGRGHGSTAFREAIRMLFEQTAVARVVGVADARNLASIRLLERVGMSRVETRETIVKEERCTEWVYARNR